MRSVKEICGKYGRCEVYRRKPPIKRTLRSNYYKTLASIVRGVQEDATYVEGYEEGNSTVYYANGKVGHSSID
jgi:hypothetical protein